MNCASKGGAKRVTLDWGRARMVQMQSNASPFLILSSSSTWLERMTPSEPLISNWQSAGGKGWKQENTVEREIRKKEKTKVVLVKRKQEEALTTNWRQIEGFWRKQKWKVWQETRDRQHKTNRERKEWRMSVADSLQPAAENRKHFRWNWSGGWKYWGAYLELDLAIHRRANENLGLKW